VLIQDVIRAAEQAGEAMGQIILSGLQSAQRKA
jgi:hypothetical protein